MIYIQIFITIHITITVFNLLAWWAGWRKYRKVKRAMMKDARWTEKLIRADIYHGQVRRIFLVTLFMEAINFSLLWKSGLFNYL